MSFYPRKMVLFTLPVWLILAGLLLYWPLAQLQAQTGTVWYVHADAEGDNDGSSWADGFTDLQDALSAAEAGDEIWVAAGVYKPTPVSTRRTAFFPLQNGVAIYGGFAGHESEREERDWQANVTVLSGDIDNNDVTDENGVTVHHNDIVGENSYRVVVGSGTDETAVLDGFTITGGQADGTADPEDGAGLYIEDGSPTLTNLIFSGNFADQEGGGLYAEPGSPILTNVTFLNNYSGRRGGGIYLRHGSPAFTNLTFTGNSSNGGGGGLYIRNSDLTLTNALFSHNQAVERGGAMVARSSSSPHLNNVTFSHNSSDDVGGALSVSGSGSHPVLHQVVFENNTAVYDGGGLFNDSGSVILTDVQFSYNSSGDSGGGIYNSTVMTMTNGILTGNSASYGGGLFISEEVTTLTNVLFSGNHAHSDGGGVYNNESTPLLTNVTFSGNRADGSGGGLYTIYEDPTIRNSIFWHNQDSSGVGTLTASIANDGDEPSNPSISYSLVQGCNPGGNWQSACGTDEGNNLADTDPLFIEMVGLSAVPTTSADLRPIQGSPVIGAGNNTFISGVPTDLNGHPRLVNGTVDLGAYETPPTLLYVDQSATGDQTGATWADALPELFQALPYAVNGTEIWVAAGIYKPTASQTDRYASLTLANEVAVYGGFAGTESEREERDWHDNLTILSGDIDDNDNSNADGVVVDPDDIVGENSYHVVVGSGTDETAVLDGFTITAGLADGSSGWREGAGLYIVEGSPTLANLTFSGNKADRDGGAFYVEPGSPTLTNVTFSHNQGRDGGGMYARYGDPVLTHVTFSHNEATRDGGGLVLRNGTATLTNIVFNHNVAGDDGGGLVSRTSSSPTLTHVTLDGNIAGRFGGGFYQRSGDPQLTDVLFSSNVASVSGGGMYNTNSSPLLTNATFIDNSAAFGGGFYSTLSGSQPVLTNISFIGNRADSELFFSAGGGLFNINGVLTLTNAIFLGNYSSYDGGGLATSSQTQLTNVTFSGNRALNEGGALWNASEVLSVRNSIFWHNQAGALAEPDDPGHTITNWEDAEATISYSLVQYCHLDGNWQAACGTDGSNNLADVDPLFIETPDPGAAPATSGNLHLQANSPAIDAGNNEYVTGISSDLDGNPRLFGPQVDLGPYEVRYSTLSVTIEGEGSVTVTPEQPRYLFGETITVTAVPATGWQFDGWQGDLSGTENPATLLVEGDMEITTVFSEEDDDDDPVDPDPDPDPVYELYLPLITNP